MHAAVLASRLTAPRERKKRMLVVESEALLAGGTRVHLRSPRSRDAAPLLTFIRALSHESWRNLGYPPEYFDSMTEEQEASFVEDLVEHPTSSS